MKCSNLNKIRKWCLFYSSQIEFLYQAGTKLQQVDNATTPMPDLLQFWVKAQLYEHTDKALNNFDVTLPQVVEEIVHQVGGRIKQRNWHITGM